MVLEGARRTNTCSNWRSSTSDLMTLMRDTFNLTACGYLKAAGGVSFTGRQRAGWDARGISAASGLPPASHQAVHTNCFDHQFQLLFLYVSMSRARHDNTQGPSPGSLPQCTGGHPSHQAWKVAPGCGRGGYKTPFHVRVRVALLLRACVAVLLELTELAKLVEITQLGAVSLLQHNETQRALLHAMLE